MECFKPTFVNIGQCLGGPLLHQSFASLSIFRKINKGKITTKNVCYPVLNTGKTWYIIFKPFRGNSQAFTDVWSNF